MEIQRTRQIAGACLVAGLCLLALSGRGDPSWWAERGVIDPQATPNDKAPANLGQLKNMAYHAAQELEDEQSTNGGAGTEILDMVGSFTVTTPANSSPINIGQLKNVAAPFYDRLMALQLAESYPWTATTDDDNDFGIANIGQLKNVFSFEVDTTPPAEVTAAVVVDRGWDWVIVEWQPSSSPDVAGYKIRILKNGVPLGDVIDVGNVTSYTLLLQDPDADYTVEIYSYDRAGNMTPMGTLGPEAKEEVFQIPQGVVAANQVWDAVWYPSAPQYPPFITGSVSVQRQNNCQLFFLSANDDEIWTPTTDDKLYMTADGQKILVYEFPDQVVIRNITDFIALGQNALDFEGVNGHENGPCSAPDLYVLTVVPEVDLDADIDNDGATGDDGDDDAVEYEKPGLIIGKGGSASLKLDVSTPGFAKGIVALEVRPTECGGALCVKEDGEVLLDSEDPSKRRATWDLEQVEGYPVSSLYRHLGAFGTAASSESGDIELVLLYEWPEGHIRSGDRMLVTVVEADVDGDFNHDDEVDESDPDDDDEHSGTGLIVPLGNTEDLVKVKLHGYPATLDSGEVVLKARALGASQAEIKVWGEPERQNLLINTADHNNREEEWDIDSDRNLGDVDEVYIEGTHKSGSAGDVELKLHYYASHGGHIATDKLLATIIKVDLLVNDTEAETDDYVVKEKPSGARATPVETPAGATDNHIPMKVRLLGPAGFSCKVKLSDTGGGDVTIKKTDGSAYPAAGETVTVGTDLDVHVFGTSSSTALNDVMIEARTDMSGSTVCGQEDLTVIWTELSFRGSGSQGDSRSSGNNKSFVNTVTPENVDELGLHDIPPSPPTSTKYAFYNNMEIEVTTTPSDVIPDVVWDIKREKKRKRWTNGVDGGHLSAWTDDDGSSSLDEDLVQGSGDLNLYAIDSPGVRNVPSWDPGSITRLLNFREWVEVRIAGKWYVISEYQNWKSILHVKNSTTPAAWSRVDHSLGENQISEGEIPGDPATWPEN